MLVLPGYSLTAAAFPGRTLGLAESILFTLALSLIITALGGLVLHWLPWGLGAGSWTVLLGSVTLGASFIALSRRRKEAAPQPWRFGERVFGLQPFLLGLAVVMVIGAVVLARFGAFQQQSSAPTQLWILPDETDQQAVRVGVRNLESSANWYTLQIHVLDQVAQEWSMMKLDPNETWETTFVLPREHTYAETVEAVLFVGDGLDTPYRRVLLWNNSQQNHVVDTAAVAIEQGPP
jgi:uncharacterized membrane protein